MFASACAALARTLRTAVWRINDWPVMSLLTRVKLCVTGQAGRMARTLGAACLQDWRDICTADDIAACIVTQLKAVQGVTSDFNKQIYSRLESARCMCSVACPGDRTQMTSGRRPAACHHLVDPDQRNRDLSGALSGKTCNACQLAVINS